MTLSEILKSYFEETPIHGFGFIPKSSSVKTTVFWTVIIVAGYGLATNDLINLIAFYQSVPTLVNVEVHRRSELEHPIPVLCIEINNFLIPPPDRHGGSASIQKYVPMLLNATNGLTEIHDPPHYGYVMSYMPYDIFYYSYAMLGFISTFQIYESQHDYDPIHPGNFDRATLDKQNLSSYMSKDIPYIEELFLTYRHYNASFENLKQFVSTIICSTYITTAPNTIVSFGGSRLEVSICSYGLFTHLSFGMMCLRIANNTVWSLKDFDLTINGLQFGQFVYGVPPPALDNAFFWHIDFQGRSLHGSNDTANVFSFPAPAPNRSDVSEIPPSFATFRSQFFDPPYLAVLPQVTTFSSLTVNVETSSYYNFFKKQSKPCQSAQQRFNLKLEQKAESFYERCSCWPTAFYSSIANTSVSGDDCYDTITSVTPSPNMAYLTKDILWLNNATYAEAMRRWSLFNKGGDITNVDNPLSYNLSGRCTAKVSNPAVENVEECDVIHFTISQTLERDWLFERQFIRIKVRNELYNAIIESPYKTWSTFMSEFGGSIGTWLGGSLIAFVHIPVFFGRIALYYYKKRKTVDCNSEETVEENVEEENVVTNGKIAVVNEIYGDGVGTMGRPITV